MSELYLKASSRAARRPSNDSGSDSDDSSPNSPDKAVMAAIRQKQRYVQYAKSMYSNSIALWGVWAQRLGMNEAAFVREVTGTPDPVELFKQMKPSQQLQLLSEDAAELFRKKVQRDFKSKTEEDVRYASIAKGGSVTLVGIGDLI